MVRFELSCFLVIQGLIIDHLYERRRRLFDSLGPSATDVSSGGFRKASQAWPNLAYLQASVAVVTCTLT
jgi:hypothetical protein